MSECLNISGVSCSDCKHLNTSGIIFPIFVPIIRRMPDRYDICKENLILQDRELLPRLILHHDTKRIHGNINLPRHNMMEIYGVDGSNLGIMLVSTTREYGVFEPCLPEKIIQHIIFNK